MRWASGVRRPHRDGQRTQPWRRGRARRAEGVRPGRRELKARRPCACELRRRRVPFAVAGARLASTRAACGDAGARQSDPPEDRVGSTKFRSVLGAPVAASRAGERRGERIAFDDIDVTVSKNMPHETCLEGHSIDLRGSVRRRPRDSSAVVPAYFRRRTPRLGRRMQHGPLAVGIEAEGRRPVRCTSTRSPTIRTSLPRCSGLAAAVSSVATREPCSATVRSRVASVQPQPAPCGVCGLELREAAASDRSPLCDRTTLIKCPAPSRGTGPWRPHQESNLGPTV